ncbi:MAG: DUF4390 domain-containing protein [Candidatus Rokubacteria bacterium]|nr:DUF4390 domain-containing protein [Candidatus Rokubacteria bacterium]
MALGLLLAATPANSELRFSDRPEIFLNDNELTVQAVLLGAVPPAFHESLQSGIPTHIRFYVELWQYSRFWVNSRLQARMLERQLAYNVVTKEYKLVSTAGEQREPYVTKDLREAQRVASEIRGLKLAAASSLDPKELYYVQVRADVSIGGVNTFLTRMTGEAEETPWIRSPLLTVTRTQ